MTLALIDADCILHGLGWIFKKKHNKLKEAWKSFEWRVREIAETVFADDSLVSVGGNGNYRKEMYPGYKGKRAKDPESKVVTDYLKECLLDHQDKYIPAHGRESDDFLRIWAGEAERAGEGFIICSGDKDLWCIPGRHYGIRTEVFKTVTPEEAERNYWQQVLSGDQVDNIPGLPGIGPIKAAELVADCKTTEDYRRVVQMAYKMKYKEDWRDWLLSNGKMIHIQRTFDDSFTLEGFR